MDWIEEYIKLLFPLNGSDIQIEKAKRLKKDYIPKRLFKYRSLNEHLLDSLKSSSLFCSRASKQNDPLECAVMVYPDLQVKKDLLKDFLLELANKSNWDENKIDCLKSMPIDYFIEWCGENSKVYTVDTLKQKIAQDSLSRKDKKDCEISEKMQDQTLICALTENFDDAAMWGYYADNHHGVCVEYDFSSAFRYPSWHMLNPVVYKNDVTDLSKYFLSKDFNCLLATYAAMIKSESWKHEREWRLISPFGSDDSDGMLVSVPLPTAIYLGININRSDRDDYSKRLGIYDELIQVLKRLKIPTYQMKKNPSSFLLDSERLI